MNMLSRKTDNLRLITYNSSSFTLLELLVVLAIMALLTGMSAPAISGYLRGARLRGSAREITSALRMARQMAITKRAVYTVDFIEATNQFYVNDGINVIGEIRTLPDTIQFTDPPGPVYPTYTYNFTARGTADDGSIFIVDPRDNGREIVVTGATGHITIKNWSP